MRAVELFAGIGGMGLGLRLARPDARIVAACDVDRAASATYESWFGIAPSPRNLESLPAAEAASWQADLWLASPPCAPFTGRGNRRDEDDPRARAFLRLIEVVAEVRPRALLVENVPGFAGSRVEARLLAVLAGQGYGLRVRDLCPTSLGIPNLRLRRYVLAIQDGLPGARTLPEVPLRPLREFLDPEDDPALRAAETDAMDVVDPRDERSISACFARSYGRMRLRGGSYLRTPDGGLRRFSPAEILRLLGFPANLAFPAEILLRTRYRLCGNSVSVPAVAAVLADLPPSFPSRSPD